MFISQCGELECSHWLLRSGGAHAMGEALQNLNAGSSTEQADPEEVGSKLENGEPVGVAEPHWHVSLG